MKKFSNLGARADIHKMLVRIANREHPDHGLFRPFLQQISVQNFRSFTV